MRKPRDYAEEYRRRLDKKRKTVEPVCAVEPVGQTLTTWADLSDAGVGYVQEGEFYYFDC